MEVKQLKNILNNKGNAIPLACAIVVCLLLISSVMMEYFRLNVIAGGVRDSLQAAVLSVATQNYDEVYNGLREGYSGGYSKDTNGAWRAEMDIGDVYTELDKLLGLEEVHSKRVGEIEEFRLSDLDIEMINTPFAPSTSDNKLTVNAKIRLKVPLSFGWESLPPMIITVRTSAKYISKF